jgi:hypothetical protein
MSRITLDAALIEKLREPMETVEVCDPSGTVVGLFTPKIDPSEYEDVGPPISDEEMRRRIESKEARYSTAEVIHYLRSL